MAKCISASKEQKPEKLSPKQERFCQELVVDNNQTQAAIRAGYSERTAKVQASRLLTKANVQTRVEELRAAQAQRTGITADRVIEELSRLAFIDLGRAYDSNGKLLNIADMDEDVRRSLSGLKVFEEFEGFGRDRTKIGETREVKTYDKIRALELLGKHLKIFTERVEHSGPGGKPIEFSDHEAAAKLAAILNAARSRKTKQS